MLTKGLPTKHKVSLQNLPSVNLRSDIAQNWHRQKANSIYHAIHLQLLTLLFPSQAALVTHQRLCIVIIIIQVGYAIHPETLAAA